MFPIVIQKRKKEQWLTGCLRKDLSTYDAAVDCSSNITFTWLTHVR